MIKYLILSLIGYYIYVNYVSPMIDHKHINHIKDNRDHKSQNNHEDEYVDYEEIE